MTVAAPIPTPGFRLVERPGWLVAAFDEPVRACSWAIVGGGIVEARSVAWIEVRNADLGLHVDPVRLVHERFAAAGLEPGVALLTSRSVASYSEARVARAGLAGRCVATVGMSNALRAGDPPGEGPKAGTINLLAYVDVPLSDAALLEALAIATEARCAAVLDSGVSSRQTGRPATGTGTDCVVVACPRARAGAPAESYAGKHTAAGSVLGAAVEQAIADGVQRWLNQ
jgi:adenosylcobinamide amidohydrolase